MTGLLLAAAIVLLSGCAGSTPPQTSTAPEPAAVSPQILHRLVLTSPQGQGSLELRREGETYRGYGGIVVTDNVVGQWRFAYTKTSLEGAGPAPGEWIDGLHALSVIVTNTSSRDVQIDWEHSQFIDPTGQTHRIVHRGVQLNQLPSPMLPSVLAAGATLNEFIFSAGGVRFSAPGRGATTGNAPPFSLWNAPAFFERLTPGAEFSVVLAIRTGDTAVPRTFRFAAVAPPPA